MWFPSSTRSHFLWFHCSNSSDRFDANWFLYFAFVLSTNSYLLYLSSYFAPYSAVSLSLCIFHTHYFPSMSFYFLQWVWQRLIFHSFSSVFSFSVSLLTYFFVFPPTHLCHFLPVVNVLISSSGGVRDKCRLSCRMANNCIALIAILHSVFRNSQIRENVCVCVCLNASACGLLCAQQPEIVQMSVENCRSTLAISFLLSG